MDPILTFFFFEQFYSLTILFYDFSFPSEILSKKNGKIFQ